MSRDVNEIIELPMDKFVEAVSRKVEVKVGLAAEDLPDIDFAGFYPGKRATFGSYREAIAECALALLEASGYPLEEEDYA
jgi:hypothetical protein